MKRKRKEMDGWLFAVNALYWANFEDIDGALFSLTTPSEKPYFWRYTFIADKKIRKEFPFLLLWADRRSLENAIGDIYIKSDNNDFIYIDSRVNRSIINEINKNLGRKINKRLSQIFAEAYKKTKKEVLIRRS